MSHILFLFRLYMRFHNINSDILEKNSIYIFYNIEKIENNFERIINYKKQKAKQSTSRIFLSFSIAATEPYFFLPTVYSYIPP